MKQNRTYNFRALYYIIFVCVALSSLFLLKKVLHLNHTKIVKSYKPYKVPRRVVSKLPNKEVDIDTGSFAALKKKMEVADHEIESNVERGEIADSAFYAIKMNQYLDRIGVSNNNKVSRSDLVIRYYKKGADEKKVYALRDLGFYIHERNSDDKLDAQGSNIIHYGDSAKREDILMVAYVLINNGLKIREISESKFHDAWKAQSIEIGADTTIQHKDVISLSQLRKDWGIE
mgnify:CR=1 FL=1